MIETESIRTKNVLLISPNLGHPLFLNIDSDLTNNKFELKLLFVSNLDSSIQFEEYIKNNISLTPILEYKWKLLEYLERFEKEKKRGIWSRVKSVFKRNQRYIIVLSIRSNHPSHYNSDFTSVNNKYAN